MSDGATRKEMWLDGDRVTAYFGTPTLEGAATYILWFGRPIQRYFVRHLFEGQELTSGWHDEQ